jgi:hypothetical protein
VIGAIFLSGWVFGPGSLATRARRIAVFARLHFDNPAAVQGGFGSAEGKAAAADVREFSTDGADMILFGNREV